MVESNSDIKITKKDLKKVFWRSLFSSATINYERFQSMGFAFAMKPVLCKLYSGKEEKKKALQRHMTMYNSHPWTISPILGMSISLEEQNAQSGDLEETIDNIKVGLMGPLAGIGDSLTWGTLRPIFAGIGASFALQGSIIGTIIFLLAWNIANFGFRYTSLFYGYSMGNKFLDQIKQSNIIQKISEGASVLGLMVLGTLVASWITISTPLQTTAGEKVISLQGTLDSIMPSMLPLLTTLLIVFLLKKDIKMSRILIGIFVLSFVASIFGILQ